MKHEKRMRTKTIDDEPKKQIDIKDISANDLESIRKEKIHSSIRFQEYAFLISILSYPVHEYMIFYELQIEMEAFSFQRYLSITPISYGNNIRLYIPCQPHLLQWPNESTNIQPYVSLFDNMKWT